MKRGLARDWHVYGSWLGRMGRRDCVGSAILLSLGDCAVLPERSPSLACRAQGVASGGVCRFFVKPGINRRQAHSPSSNSLTSPAQSPPTGIGDATENMLWRPGATRGVAQGCYTIFDAERETLWVYEYAAQHDSHWDRGSRLPTSPTPTHRKSDRTWDATSRRWCGFS